jgi:putative effector of murein hydrolase
VGKFVRLADAPRFHLVALLSVLRPHCASGVQMGAGREASGTVSALEAGDRQRS